MNVDLKSKRLVSLVHLLLVATVCLGANSCGKHRTYRQQVAWMAWEALPQEERSKFDNCMVFPMELEPGMTLVFRLTDLNSGPLQTNKVVEEGYVAYLSRAPNRHAPGEIIPQRILWIPSTRPKAGKILWEGSFGNTPRIIDGQGRDIALCVEWIGF